MRTLASAATLAILSGSAFAQQQPARYTVIDLGGASNSTPSGVGNSGHVSGNYYAPNGQRRAFLWDGFTSQDLGSLGGISQTGGVNSQGVAVGYSVDAQNRQRAVRMQAGLVTDLGTLTGGTHAAAYGINSSGWIVGMSQGRFGTEVWQRAAIWRNGTVTDLGTFGGEFSEARNVSDVGHVVGWAWYPLPTRAQHAFRWTQSGGMVDLGTLGGAGSHSFALDVNNQGTVVGTSLGSNGYRAFIWTEQNGIQDLGVAPGTAEAFAGGINSQGQVVGYCSTLNEDCSVTLVPTLWNNGSIIALNQQLDPASGWILTGASDINDRGEITATGYNSTNSGVSRALLLRPIISCTADFNGDGDFGTDADIESFFACLAGNCCPTCANADFNADGDTGTDADIESFFRVLAGGAC